MDHIAFATALGTFVRQKQADASDLLNPGWPGFLADTIGGMGWGQERAGRAEAMARAAGKEAPFSVRHPALHTLGGTLAGALGGGALGAGVVAPTQLGTPGGADDILTGAGVGAVGGGLLGLILAKIQHRKNMKTVARTYDAAKAKGKVKAVDPEFSALSALLLPGRGPHRYGNLTATRAIRAGNDDIQAQRSGWNDVGYAAGPFLQGPTTGIAPLLQEYAQNAYTQFADPKYVGDNTELPDAKPRKNK